MKRVVISQPMFFPWVGMFEQIRLADVYVHYPDVQFSKGSFTNRVQLKTDSEIRWLTVPLQNVKLGQKIDEIEIDDRRDWRRQQVDLFQQWYAAAPHFREALQLLTEVHSVRSRSLNELVIHSMDVVLDYYRLREEKQVFDSSQLGVGGKGSERVLAIVQKVGGDVYVTGHGAKNYLDHEAFERAGVCVEYIDYQRREYPQLHGPFNPHVSILDLVANMGAAGREWICSRSIPWREFLSK
ncbi:MAG: WbqC family protein [Planctomycetota bacterium]